MTSTPKNRQAALSALEEAIKFVRSRKYLPEDTRRIETLITAAQSTDALRSAVEFEIKGNRKKVAYIRYRCEEKKTTLCDAVLMTHDMLMTAARLEKALEPAGKEGE